MKLLRLCTICLALLFSSVSVASADLIEILGTTSGSYFESATPNSNTSVYMIGVYESVNGGGTATVDIGDQFGRDTVLVLSSYEPTQWNLTGDGVDDLSRVLLYGYNEQTATGVNQGLVSEFSYEGSVRNYQGYTFNFPGDGEVVSHFQSETGLNVDAFAGTYAATQFSIAAVAVPEPNSLCLLAAFGLVAGLRRRQRSA